MLYSLMLSIFDDAYYLVGGLLRAALFGIIYCYASNLNFRLLPTIAKKGKTPPATVESSGKTV